MPRIRRVTPKKVVRAAQAGSTQRPNNRLGPEEDHRRVRETIRSLRGGGAMIASLFSLRPLGLLLSQKGFEPAGTICIVLSMAIMLDRRPCSSPTCGLSGPAFMWSASLPLKR